MSDEPIEVRVRVTGSAPITFLTEDIVGGRFEPPRPPAHYVLNGVRLSDVDFSGLRLESMTAQGCTFERCDFTRARFHRSSLSFLSQSTYTDCLFDRTDLRVASPGSARFVRCTFDHARIDGWRMWGTEFIGCRFVGPLRHVEFRAHPGSVSAAQPRERNEIRDNDFRGIDMEDVEFLGGVDLDAQLWPDDPSYVRLDIRPETLDRLAPFVPHLSPEDERRADLGWVRGRFAGQPEILIRDGTWQWYRNLLRLAARN
jgi:hypothetical protein